MSTDGDRPTDVPTEEAPTLADPRHQEESDRPRVAGYTLLQRLGEGGIGEVWLAEQHGHLRRKVALKLIRADSTAPHAVARFESERQALALMSHACIARVFDAGVTESGRPYFAMEYVHGPTLTAWCDASCSTLRARLDLFLAVCAGVQHAHQKGIIHRDLKPSNVLIAETAEGPLPKIIDFGIAKALDHRLTDRTLQTMAGDVVGTPEYMSPEQASGTPDDIDTRSDVYSLGVLLYQLLTGRLPFREEEDEEKGRPSFSELQRRILEDEPPRPSARVTGAGERATWAATRRAVDPTGLGRQLRGDLDWIVLRALEKDRNRRYASPGELAADICRHLGDEPVVAGPPSVTYRTFKFVRRHRFGVTAAALVAGALALGMAGTARGLLQAREEAATAEQVTRFLEDVFAGSQPSIARGKDVSLRDALDQGARRIGREFADRPLLRARLELVMGRTYLALGLHDEAEPLLQDAADRRAVELGENHEETLRARSDVARLLVLEARYPEAERLLGSTLEAQRVRPGLNHDDTLTTLETLSALRMNQARGEEAEVILRQVIAARTHLQGEEHLATLRARNALGFLLVRLERYEEAESVGRETLAACRATVGEDRPETLKSLNVVGSALLEQGRNVEAIAVHAEALAINRRVQGPDHPATLARLNNLAAAHDRNGDLVKAEEHYREAIDRQRRALDPDHPDTVRTMMNFGALLMREGRHDEAAALLTHAVEARGRRLGEDHSATVDSVGLLATLRWDYQRRADLAEPLLRRVIEWRERRGDRSRRLWGELYMHACALVELGRRGEAERQLDKHVTLAVDLLGPEHHDLPLRRALRAILLGRMEECLSLVEDYASRAEACAASLDQVLFDAVRAHPRFVEARRRAAVLQRERGKDDC